jgi:hypothetical protein
LDPVGGHNDHVFVEPGHYNFPGYLALAYARNRYTDGGDIDRANRQQQVIFAIRNRLTEPDMLPYFISRAPSLYQELSAGIHTNMPLEDALRLGMLAKDIQITSIKKGVISYDMMQQVNTTQGEALQPIPSDIRILRDEIFTTGGALGPLMVGDALTRMQAEKARVAILNGSTYEGLGARTGEYLTAQGMNVTLVGNIGDNLALASGGNFQGYTVAIDYTGKPYAMSYLAELMALTSNRVYSDLNLGSAVDVVVVLGDDWGASNPMP